MIFTSSVAVYGLNKDNPDENHPKDPFNDYGKSKLKAVELIKSWYDNDPKEKNITIIRPTVIFGEKNRGNVYKLLRQIASNRFLLVGNGNNKKSMAYVGNVVSFIKYRLDTEDLGFHIFNYVDKPDFTMKSLLFEIESKLNLKILPFRIPIWLGFLFGYGFDLLSFLLKKEFAISSVRIKKFIATTQFNAHKAHSTKWNSPFTLKDALHRTLDYEFIQNRSEDDEVFYTE